MSLFIREVCEFIKNPFYRGLNFVRMNDYDQHTCMYSMDFEESSSSSTLSLRKVPTVFRVLSSVLGFFIGISQRHHPTLPSHHVEVSYSESFDYSRITIVD